MLLTIYKQNNQKPSQLPCRIPCADIPGIDAGGDVDRADEDFLLLLLFDLVDLMLSRFFDDDEEAGGG